MVLELLAELVDFWWDDLAVWVRAALQVPVVLMVVFRHIKLL